MATCGHGLKVSGSEVKYTYETGKIPMISSDPVYTKAVYIFVFMLCPCLENRCFNCCIINSGLKYILFNSHLLTLLKYACTQKGIKMLHFKSQFNRGIPSTKSIFSCTLHMT